MSTERVFIQRILSKFAGRTRRVFILLPVLALVLSSCHWEPGRGFNFGEANPEPQPLEVNLSRFSCMREIGKKVTAYVDGNLDKNQLNEYAECIQSALSRFQDLVIKQGGQYYDPYQLATFLNREYLADSKINPEFVKEIMAIKVVLFGGTNDRFSSGEMVDFISFIGFFRDLALSSLPYIKIYNQSLASGPTDNSTLTAARKQLVQNAYLLAQRLALNNKNYHLENLVNLILDVRGFLKWDQEPNSLFNKDGLTNLLTSIKEVALGNRLPEIQSSDWPSLLDTIASSYGIYSSFKVKNKTSSLVYGDGFEHFDQLLQEALALLTRLVGQQPRKLIPFSASDRLFDVLETVQLLPAGIHSDSIKILYNRLVQYGLYSPMFPFKREAVTGLSPLQVNELQSEVMLWSDAQRSLNQNLTTRNYLDVQSPMTEEFSFDQNQELKDIIDHIRPMFKDKDPRAFVVPKSELSHFNVVHGIHDLTNLNFIHATVRMMIRMFADESHILSMKGLSAAEMDLLYKTIKPIGADLMLLDPHDKESGFGLFKTGKLFTFSGDGMSPSNVHSDDTLDFYQTMEMLGLIWSGGKVRNVLYDHMRDLCLSSEFKDGPLDVFNKPMISRKCFENNFYQDNLNAFTNLPFLRNDFLKINDEQKQVVLGQLQEISFYQGKSNGLTDYVDFSEIGCDAMVLHYLEVLFSTYDLNNNNLLETREVLRAYGRFHGPLSDKVEKTEGHREDEKMLKAIYLVLAQKQAIPTMMDYPKLLMYKWLYLDDDPKQFDKIESQLSHMTPAAAAAWVDQNLPKVEMDRVGLLKIMTELAK